MMIFEKDEISWAFNLLRINKTSSIDEIKKAFREMAKENHPDAHIDIKSKEECHNKFIELCDARDLCLSYAEFINSNLNNHDGNDNTYQDKQNDFKHDYKHDFEQDYKHDCNTNDYDDEWEEYVKDIDAYFNIYGFATATLKLTISSFVSLIKANILFIFGGALILLLGGLITLIPLVGWIIGGIIIIYFFMPQTITRLVEQYIDKRNTILLSLFKTQKPEMSLELLRIIINFIVFVLFLIFTNLKFPIVLLLIGCSIIFAYYYLRLQAYFDGENAFNFTIMFTCLVTGFFIILAIPSFFLSEINNSELSSAVTVVLSLFLIISNVIFFIAIRYLKDKINLILKTIAQNREKNLKNKAKLILTYNDRISIK